MQITVVGTHDWSLAPERATVHLHVDVEGDDRTTTSRSAAAAVDALAAELQRLREGPDAVLTAYVVGPLVTRSWRPWGNDGQPLPPRFGASAQLRGTFSDFAALADWTGAWAERDGVQVAHVEWALKDATLRDTEETALALAVEDARRRATAIARAAGWAGVELHEVADPGLLVAPPGGGPIPAAGAREMALSAKADAGRGQGLSPEDVRGGATIHARFVAHR